MEKISIIFAIMMISSIYTSCCKGPYPVAVLTINYPDLSGAEMLKAIRTDRNNLSVIIDTINIAELNASNNYSAILEFENDPSNYIIYLENTQYIDTISDIIIEREGCKEKIVNFQYQFNGQTRTDHNLTIN